VEVPADGQWYRFFVRVLLVGGSNITVTIGNDATSSGVLEVDAVKFEYEVGSTTDINPTSYNSTDWGAGANIRNFAAENITTGTLVVGGSNSANPLLTVKDGTDTVIVQIGKTAAYYGILVSSGAGVKVTGVGDIEVSGGGDILVNSGGSIYVDGGKIIAGTVGAARMEMTSTGLIGYDSLNAEQVRMDATDGRIKIKGTGSVVVEGGGSIIAGNQGGARLEYKSTGIYAYNAGNVQTVGIDATDGIVRIEADFFQITGTLSMTSLALTGALTVGGNFTVGANVLFVDQAQSIVGINKAPDLQFDLDVNGSFRAGGYIVGKHALQIKDALLVAHFDGAGSLAPFGDVTGHPNGHLGQVADVSGAVWFYPGKFNKGVLIQDGYTNKVKNPSVEVDLTGITGTNATVTRDNTGTLLSGSWHAKIVNSATSPRTVDWDTDSFAVSTTYSASAMVRGTNGQSVSICLWDGVSEKGSSTLVLVGTGWQIIKTSVAIASNATTLKVRIKPASGNGQTVYVDQVNCAVGSYAYAYVDGSLNYGKDTLVTWAGTPHNSASTRIDPVLAYPWQNNINPARGTISMWVLPPPVICPTASGREILINANAEANSSIMMWRDRGTDFLHAKLINDAGTNSIITSGALDWTVTHHIAWVWTTNDIRLYVDGVSVGTPITTFTPPTTFGAGKLYIGRQSDTAQRWANKVIDDLVIVNRALTTQEVRAIYESDAPVFAETSSWGFRTANTLAWADSEGLWAINNTGAAAFGVSGVDSKSWGNLTGGILLDKGDVLLGNNSSYVLWDASAGILNISGTVSLGGTFTSATIKTAASGARAEMDSAGLRIIHGSGANANYVRWMVDVGEGGSFLYADRIVSDIYAVRGTQNILYLRGTATGRDGWINLLADGANPTTVVINSTKGSVDIACIEVSVEGNLGVGGTTSPTATLDVLRGTAGNGTALLRGTTYNSIFNYSTAENTYIRGGKSTSSVYVNDQASGDVFIAGGGGDVEISNNVSKVGLGIAPVAANRVTIKGHANTAGTYGLVVKDNSSQDILVLQNDRLYNWSVVAWTIGSDRKLKQNITPVESALTVVRQLKPVQYELIDSPQKSHSGFIAQDIQEIPGLGHLVSAGGTSEENKHLSLAYEELHPYWAGAIQELDGTVQFLKQTVVDLLKEVESLKMRLDYSDTP
jgi:hypothetical protein